jgi:hypothetical protein
VATEPNQIWTADYKGHFKMRNGAYCYPLSVCDMYSRYLLDCDGHRSISMNIIPRGSHEALNIKTPSEVYTPSAREMPKKLGIWNYPYHFKVRRVSRTGAFRWQSKREAVKVRIVLE